MYPRLSDLIRDLTGIDVPLPFYTYGTLLAAAILTSAYLTGRRLDRLQATGVMALGGERPSRRERGPRAASDVMPGVLALAFVLGLAGSRLFFILESFGAFLADPLGTLAAGRGLSFYGGFLFAAPAIVWYVRRHGLSVGRFVDAAAPTILLAYGIARIGCQLSGDGDWGIAADLSLKPAWLPAWLWAQTYPGNVQGVTIAPPGVYPTPIYETAASFALAAVLFALRDHSCRPGWLFFLMVVCMGLERFSIEKIRVNPRFELAGIEATQAELISVALVIGGGVGLWLFGRRAPLPGERP